MGDHDLADRLDRCGKGVDPDWAQIGAGDLRLAAARLRHLDRILDAIGDPNLLNRVACFMSTDEAYLDRIAAAVRDTDA